MKKVMILLVIALTANVMMAQKKDRTDAFMYNKNQQYEKAMKSIEKCVNHEQFLGMKPNDQSQAWLYRAAIYQNILQSGDEALKAQAPNATEIIYESLMNCMKNPEFLEENKQEIYQRVGSVMTTYYSKGADDYNAGKFAEAAPMFKKAYDIAKSLGSPEANDMLNLAATSALRAQDFNTALTYFNEVKANGVDNVDIYKHLAACYNGLGNAVPLGFKAIPSPVPFGARQKLIVVFQRIIERIEVILDVPEKNAKRKSRPTDRSPHSESFWKTK